MDYPLRPTDRTATLGPWGTSRAIERAFGYTPPTRNRFSDLQLRLEELERWRDALEGWDYYFDRAHGAADETTP